MNGQNPKDRKASILDSALRVAEKIGYQQMTREQIAKQADVSPALVSHYLGTMAEMRRTVMRHACTVKNLPVIAQGLASRDKHALRVPADVREAAGASLAAR
jgi:AcrR family transcriptional regulator